LTGKFGNVPNAKIQCATLRREPKFLLILQSSRLSDLVISGQRNAWDAKGRALFFAGIGSTRF
jgi:hypothetical protein